MRTLNNFLEGLNNIEKRSSLYYLSRFVKQAKAFEEYEKDIFEDAANSNPNEKVKEVTLDMISFIEMDSKKKIADFDDNELLLWMDKIAEIEDLIDEEPDEIIKKRAINELENFESLLTKKSQLIVNGKPEVRIRAFRAIDEPNTCMGYIYGQEEVLKSIGIKKSTVFKNEWVRNPSVFLIVVESIDRTKIFGGARIHVANGTDPLPIEQAMVSIDPDITEKVWDFAKHGSGELCGIWNSRQVAGYGLGIVALLRVAVAISSQIGIQTLFALVAPYGVLSAEAVGMTTETSMGFEGNFPYRGNNSLIATVMLLKDVDSITNANQNERLAILQIRENLNATRVEMIRKGEITINYNLEIKGIKNWNIGQIIKKVKKNIINVDDEVNLDFLHDLEIHLQ